MRNKINAEKRLLVGLILLAGCYQEPDLPQSIIPLACRIAQIDFQNQSEIWRTNNEYDAFGNLLTYRKQSYRWTTLLLTEEVAHTYSDNHYLQSKVVKTKKETGEETVLNYTYRYQGNPQLLQEVLRSGTSAITYEYEGNRVKTYTEKNENGTVNRVYYFDASGLLNRIEQPGNTQEAFTIVNGKIAKKTAGDGSVEEYEYNPKGELIRAVVTRPGTSERMVTAYTYDDKPYQSVTLLRFKGIPDVSLGTATQVNNVLTSRVEKYKNDALVTSESVSYRHVYNSEGYSLGYASSDGTRQTCYYINCK